MICVFICGQIQNTQRYDVEVLKFWALNDWTAHSTHLNYRAACCLQNSYAIDLVCYLTATTS